MSWNTKTKIASQGDDEEIRTPDNLTILVGSSEDQNLLYQESFDDWNIKTKIPA